MNENQIYNGIGNILTDKPYTMVVPVRLVEPVQPLAHPKRTLIDKLLRKPIPVQEQPVPKTHREFTIYPCVVANMYRVAGNAASLPDEILEGTELTGSVMPLIPEHLPTMVYIIAAAIQNNHMEPEQELIQFIERNFTSAQIAEALYASFEGLGLQDFLNSIVLAKGTVAVLKPKTSPEDGRELIASHTAV